MNSYIVNFEGWVVISEESEGKAVDLLCDIFRQKYIENSIKSYDIDIVSLANGDDYL